MLTHDSASSVPDAWAAPDLAEIGRALDILLERGGCTELRVLHNSRRTDSGYFVDAHALIDAACTLVQGNAYVLLNPANPALAARAYNRLEPYAKQTTTDQDVTRRRWLLIDIEHQRPAGIAATNAEHDAALERAERLVPWLTAQGIPPRSIVFADSGNGSHLLVRVDLPNDDASTALVRRILAAVALVHGDESVKIDQSVHNAARIVRIYGTMNCKGDSIPERPHRQARILSAPDGGAQPVDRDVLERIAALAPSEALQPARQGSGGGMQAFIDTYHPDVLSGRIPWGSGHQKWHVVCPFNPEHAGTSAALLEMASGALAFKCQHDSCQGKDWQDVKAHFGVQSLNGYAHMSARPASLTTTTPTSAPTIVVRSFSQIQPTPVEFLWRPRIVTGTVTIVAGDGGLGKSYSLCDVATKLSMGEPLPGTTARWEPSDTLFLIGEDDAGSVVRPRLDVLGADVTRVHHVAMKLDEEYESTIPLTPENIAAIADHIQAYTPAMVVIDPVLAYCPPNVDPSKPKDVRLHIMQPLGTVARRTNTAIVLVIHLNKSVGLRASYRIQGAQDFRNAARSVLLYGRDPERPERTIVIHDKTNYAELADPLAYEFQDGRFTWITEGIEATSADELLGPQMNTADRELLDLYDSQEGAVGPLTPQMVSDALAIYLEAAKKRLQRAAGRGTLTRIRHGEYEPGTRRQQ